MRQPQRVGQERVIENATGMDVSMTIDSVSTIGSWTVDGVMAIRQTIDGSMTRTAMDGAKTTPRR